VDRPQGIPALYNASYIIQSGSLCGSARDSWFCRNVHNVRYATTVSLSAAMSPDVGLQGVSLMAVKIIKETRQKKGTDSTFWSISIRKRSGREGVYGR